MEIPPGDRCGGGGSTKLPPAALIWPQDSVTVVDGKVHHTDPASSSVLPLAFARINLLAALLAQDDAAQARPVAQAAWSRAAAFDLQHAAAAYPALLCALDGRHRAAVKLAAYSESIYAAREEAREQNETAATMRARAGQAGARRRDVRAIACRRRCGARCGGQRSRLRRRRRRLSKRCARPRCVGDGGHLPRVRCTSWSTTASARSDEPAWLGDVIQRPATTSVGTLSTL